MTVTDPLKQIPEGWQDLIEQSEIDDEITKVNDELTAFASSRLNLESPSPEEVIEECATTWNTTVGEVQKSWQTIINRRATTRLFTRYYGHLFPKDENGELILSAGEMVRMYGKS